MRQTSDLLLSVVLLFVCLLSRRPYADGYVNVFQRNTVTRDFCNMEIFTASCLENESIIIDGARYGRMSVGRCMRSSYGYEGCAVDVHRFMDSKCSGRQMCRFQVPDPTLYEMQPCPVDFTSYLEVTYSCIPIVDTDRSLCDRHKPLRAPGFSGFISTESTEDHGIGSSRCPWMIEGSPGQRINLTLYNFGYLAKSGHGYLNGPVRPDVCFEVAIVTDGSSRRPVTICGSDPREISVLETKSNLALLEFTNIKMLKNFGAFLLRYKIFGCSYAIPLPPDSEAWYEQTSDTTMLVRCNASGQTWHLSCSGTRWVGEIGNCTGSYFGERNGWNVEQIFNADDSFPFGLLIAVSLGVAMGIVIGGMLLCSVTLYFRRFRRNFNGYSQPKEQYVYMSYPSPSVGQQQQQQPQVAPQVSHWIMNDQLIPDSVFEPDLCSSCKNGSSAGASLTTGCAMMTGCNGIHETIISDDSCSCGNCVDYVGCGRGRSFVFSQSPTLRREYRKQSRGAYEIAPLTTIAAGGS